MSNSVYRLLMRWVYKTLYPILAPHPPRILWGPKIPKPATVRNTTFFVKSYHKEHIFRS